MGIASGPRLAKKKYESINDKKGINSNQSDSGGTGAS